MSDSKIRNLTETVVSGDLATLLDTLYLAVDDTTFTNAKKVLLKTILTEAVISSNANNYQAMTPKAFYDSVMTTTRKGIAQLASDSDVTEKRGVNLLNSAHQIIMQAQWLKDWFIANGQPASYYKNANSENAMSLQVNVFQQFTQYQTMQINPTLPAGKRIDGVVFQVITSHSTVNNQFIATNWLKYNGTARYYWIDSSSIGLLLSADGKTLSVVNNYAATGNVTLSATINIIIKDI